MRVQPLLTQFVGSYAKPNWLMCHHRVTTPYADETFWRPEANVLLEAQDDATLLAIADQERAGLDVVTDGEQRRHRFDTYFLRFNGLDTSNLARWSMDNRNYRFVDLTPEVKKRLDQAQAPRVSSSIANSMPCSLKRREWPSKWYVAAVTRAFLPSGRKCIGTRIVPSSTSHHCVQPAPESRNLSPAGTVNFWPGVH